MELKMNKKNLPEFLLPFYEEALEYLSKNFVKDIEFSGPTYQIEVEDPTLKKTVWAFLQIDHKGNIKDCFCSCEHGEEANGCVHVTAAFLRIFNNTAIPLHLRYENSLWNKLCFLYADRVGYDIQCLKKLSEGHYVCRSISGKQLFSIQATDEKMMHHLNKIMQNRPIETEETSIKFSNLSPVELELWRSGRPSSLLRYELSFWNDLAKWLMLMQDGGVLYEIKFEYSPMQLPNEILISFPDLLLSFYISEANLPLIIPTLKTVKSPLFIHNTVDEVIKEVVYDQLQSEMHIKTIVPATKNTTKSKAKKKAVPDALMHGRSIDGWTFVPGDGFFSKEHHSFFNGEILKGDKITEALDVYFQVIQNHLIHYTIDDKLTKPSYQIFFDELWNLHIISYIFEPGDMLRPYSKRYGDWIFLENDGFYRIEGLYFDKIKTIIPAEQISDFINLHRPWLNMQEGFHTHLITISTELISTVTDKNELIFYSQTEKIDETATHHDFGSWVYVKDLGFYSRAASHLALPIQIGVPIPAYNIPLFIRMNVEELKLIPNFFSAECPIKSAKLKVELSKDEVILVSPEYEMHPAYENKEVRFFEDYVYVPNEGFSLLPPEMRLPEQYHHPLEIHESDQEHFINFQLPAITKYIKYLDPHLTKPKYITLVAEQIEPMDIPNEGNYQLKIAYQTDIGTLNAVTVRKGINQNLRFLFSSAGLLDLEDESFNWIKQLPKQKIDQRNNKITLSTLELIRLNAFHEIQTLEKGHQTSSGIQKILHEFKEFIVPYPPDLSNFRCTLRSYQSNGVAWLWFLYYHRLSGLLCDDMGLGKTHQAMALIAAIDNLRKASSSTNRNAYFLVVCPTSVIYHWEDKLGEFLPDLPIHTYYGLERSIDNFQQTGGLLLTSYGIWRRDASIFNNITFELAIFDEIQIAKSHTSQVHAALLQIKALMKLGLTGTPIENRLRELKSLFDIVLPNYMPNDADYNTFFVKPIERDNNLGKKMLLMRFITPFVLRRKKENVLKDLPEKTEEVAHCALLQDQKKLYHQILNRSRTKLLQELQEEDTPIPYMHIFSLLSSLKQICNHPAAYLKEPEKYKEYHSGKWNLFLELLHEARESGQKVVIFSQYLMMIDIIENYLKEKQIGYATIRGATADRAYQVRNFNKNPKCEVFIGSLQAAGLGIDLTAASVVIHYDRWWTAARENQATDRVHRLGQKNPGVQVFKLVTKGTFEETIDRLILRKGQLMEDIIGTDEQNLVKRFNRRELIELLQDVEESRDAGESL